MSTASLTDHQTQDSFSRYVGISVLVHVTVLVLFLVKAVIFPLQEDNNLDAIRVDMVALPDKVQPQAMAPETPAEKPPEVAPKAAPQPTPVAPVAKIPEKVKDPTAVNLESTKKKEKAAFDRLKEMSALEKIADEERNDKKKKVIESMQKFKGNAISTGADLHGVAKLKHDEYLGKVEAHIRRFWSLPEWLAQKNLTAQVEIHFDESGQITAKKIIKSSGNPSFDEVVMNTLSQAVPLPPPPQEFVTLLANEGMVIGFPE